MANISNLNLPDSTKYGIRAVAIPFGQVDSTSTSTVFTVTVPGIFELSDGVCLYIRNGVVTSAEGFTINVNGTGAKPCYNNMATGNSITPTAPTRDTTIFNINYTMLFVYSESIVEGGGWICYRGYNYDSNDNTVGYLLRTNSAALPAADTGYRYRLWFTSVDGQKFVPINTSTSTNATTARSFNTRPIDPFGPIIYRSTNGTLTAGSVPGVSALWQQYPISIGYSYVKTLTANQPVYLKCTPQSEGGALMEDLVQTLPTSEDGKIYIYLGIAYAAGTMELRVEHPIYYYKNGQIREWSNLYIPTALSQFTNDTGFITDAIQNIGADTGGYTSTDTTTLDIYGTNGIATSIQQAGAVYIGHSNSVTPDTVGTSSATSGSTLAVPYATYDSYGHIKTKGTHTHTITGFIPTTEKGAASGVAPLNGSSKIDETYLPSYVDDIIEGYYYNNKFWKEGSHTTEITGETGKIYLDLTTDRIYRWSGSTYVEVSTDTNYYHQTGSWSGLTYTAGKVGSPADLSFTIPTGTASTNVAVGNHVHGNITNGGALQTTDISIASGDKLVVTDSSDSAKVARTSVSFDGATATKALTQKGTWESFTNNAGTITRIKTASGTHTAIDVTSGSATFNVPTKTSQLTNDSNFVTTDTKNTAGATDNVSKLFLIGATAQTANPQTYSNADLFFEDGLHAAAADTNNNWSTSIAQTSQSVILGALDSANTTGATVTVDALGGLTVTEAGNHGSITLSNTGLAITGLITPANNTDAATKKYVDDGLSGKAASTHSHGNITSAGAITSDTAASNGDKLVVTDSSNSAKLIRTSIAFDGATTSKALTPKGTWESFSNNSGTVTSVAIGNATGETDITIAGSPVTTSGTITITHANSITASTAGTSAATSGSTLAVPYVTYDKHGHITAAGTHTHTINGFSTTDKKLEVAGVTSGTTYYPLVGTGSAAATRQYDTTGLVYVGTNGTTTAVGTAALTLGNSTASGTANNKQGQLIIYGTNAKKLTLVGAAPSADATITLPSVAGTLALIGDIEGSYLPLTGGAVSGATSITDLTAGDLVVTGAASFANNAQFNTINGVAVGSAPKFTDTVTTATTSGTGNVVSGVTATNGALTVTKTTVPTVDTKNTAGATASTSKLFLIGATAQDANPQTYSNASTFVSASKLYSASKAVLVGGSNASSAVTIKATTTSVYSMTSAGSVTAGSATTPAAIDTSKFSAGTLTFTMDSSDTKKLKISFTAPTFQSGFYTAGTKGTPTSVTLPGRSSAINAWTGYTTGVANTYAAAQTFTGATS